jgi:hypothetical protein
MSPTAGATGDSNEIKDKSANVDDYVSATGEWVAQYGLALGGAGGRFGVAAAATATAPANVSVIYSNASIRAGGVAVTIPGAQTVAPGRVIVVADENGSSTTGNLLNIVTPTGGGTIDGTAQGTPVAATTTTAHSSSAWYSDGVNWNHLVKPA